MKNNNNRKISKIIIILISIISLLIIGTLIFILNFLPGPKEIKSKMLSQQEIISSSESPIDEKSKDIDRESNSQQVDKTNTELEDKPSAIDAQNNQTKTDLIKQIFEQENVLTICENLRDISTYKVGEGKDQVDFDTIFKKESDNDPILGTIRYSITHVFKDESLSSLMKEVFNSKISEAGESEKSSILEKMNFYAKAAKTAITLRSRRKEFEAVADRTEHLRLLAMIAQLKPNQAYDSSFLETCNSLQTSILNNEEVDIKMEREMVLKIIKSSGLTPKRLKFNPKNFTSYEVKFTKDGLTFKLDSEDDKKSN